MHTLHDESASIKSGIDPMLRADVLQLIQSHLDGINPAQLPESEKWSRYRTFRAALHDVCGCAAGEWADNGLFIRGIQAFCRGVEL